jgi:hypothetical protein
LGLFLRQRFVSGPIRGRHALYQTAVEACCPGERRIKVGDARVEVDDRLLHRWSSLDDDSRTNASPAVSDGQVFLRTDRNLCCIGR